MNLLNSSSVRIDVIKNQLLSCLLITLLSGFSQHSVAVVADNLSDQVTSSNTPTSLLAMLEQTEQLRQQGYYHEALIQYQTIEELAEQSTNSQYAVLASGLRGYLLFLMRDYVTSEQLLLAALQHSVDANWSLQSAIHANHLGNFYAARNKASKALQFYQEARVLAQKNTDIAFVARIDINQLKLLSSRNPTQAWKDLLRLQEDLKRIDELGERAQLQSALAFQALQLDRPPSVTVQQYQQFTQTRLQEALQLATAVSSPRLRSNAYRYLGQFAEQQQQFATALQQTQLAIAALQGIDAKDLLLKLEWQRGRVLRQLGNNSEAIAAYRLSVSHIQAIRDDIPVDYQNGRSSFRETLQPVYIGLADLLIQQADKSSNKAAQQAILREARNTIERIKQTELEDYFENRCTLQSLPEQAIENIAANTAAIYPVILDDRLELLISISGNIEHRSVAVSSAQLTQTAKQFAGKLRHFEADYLKESVQLYNWLIAPLATLLQRQQIDTIVFIPDGTLRLVPLAALSNGSRFLMQDYAIVTSPGLKLFDPKPLPRNKLDTLLAGLSMPGAVVEDLPPSSLSMVINAIPGTQTAQRSVIKSRDINQLLLSVNQLAPEISTQSIQQLIKDPAISRQARQILALPGVSDEIKQLSELLPATVLLNETYSKKRLNQAIKQTPFRIIHIASHGVFGGSASESYIMAHDKIISVTELETLLQSSSQRENPIELLTLSACQTAEGDDRSPLGISGIALKAKVRSALGSLWSVADIATVNFMTRFYQQLKTNNTSKAQALQQAQQYLLNNPEYQHPFFWSPFILIGNWL